MNLFAGAIQNMQNWLLKKFTGGKVGTLEEMQDLLTSVGLGTGEAGIHVTPSNVMQLSAAFACLKVLMEDIPSLPIITYRRIDDQRRTRATDHRLYNSLRNLWNEEMTSYMAMQILVADMCTRGAGCAEIQRTRGGDAIALWPIPKQYVTPKRDENGRLYYEVASPTGGDPTKIDMADMLYIPGMCINDIVGTSPISASSNTLSLALAVQKTASLHFANGGTVKEVMKTEFMSGSEAAEAAKADWKKAHGTLSKAQRTLFLTQGMEYTPIFYKLADLLPVDVENQQVAAVARLFRMPLHKIGQMDRATWGNVEQMSLEYLQGCLRPWLVNFEQHFLWKLRRLPADNDIYFEFLVEALLRGDINTRYRAYAIGRQWGWLSANDIRTRENLDPIPDGDTYLTPGNMLPAGTQELQATANLQPLAEDVTERIVKRARADVGRMASKKDTTGLSQRLDAYFDGDFSEYVADTLRPLTSAAGLED